MKVSIIIPTFNRAAIIPSTLDSIWNQSYKEWECIVVDDGSSDDTPKVIEKYCKSDSRFRYLRNSRKKGAQGARNTGVLESAGAWVVFFDSDNIMHQDFLLKLTSHINTNVDVCSCWSRVIEKENGNQVGTFKWGGQGQVHSALLSGKSYFDNSSTIIRKSKILEIGLLDEECPSFQEWDTHLRLSNICQYLTVEECLVDYYTGGKDSISSDNKREINGYIFILSKFQSEWLHNNCLAYIKYCYILKKKIDACNIDALRQQSNSRYNHVIPMIIRILVKCLTIIK